MEIKVEPKRRMIGPLIAGALLFGALLWALVDLGYVDERAAVATRESDDPAPAGGTPGGGDAAGRAGGVAAAAPEVDAFTTFVESNELQMSRAHEYTAEGLGRLGAALEVMSRDAGDDARERQNRFTQAVQAVQQDAASAQHTERVRTTFLAAADSIEAIGRARGMDSGFGDRLDELRDTAGSLDPAKPLLDQEDAVKRFFDRSAVILRTLAAR